MKRTQNFTLLAVFLLLSQLALGFDLTKINLSYHYDLDADVRFAHRTADADSALVIFYEVTADTTQNWTLNFIIQENYNSETHDTLSNFSIDTLRTVNTTSLVRLSIEPPEKNSLMLAVFANLNMGSYRVFDIPLSLEAGFPKIYPIDQSGFPIVSSFVKSREVRFGGGVGDSIHTYQYAPQFKATDPPMGQMGPLAPTLQIDTSFNLSKTSARLEEKHFYLFQQDTLDQNGITLLRTPGYYPEMKRIDELIGPMQYITTESENKSLNSGVDTKGVFEKFWINTYGTKFRAKGAIKSFFTMVEQSNMLFTDYREGWKTDRGMLYIVFGMPDVVSKDKNTETWKYSNGTTFEFIRISTLFAPSFYSLKRDIKYEDIWYNRIGNIRKG